MRDKNATIIAVLLLGHVGWPEAEAQPVGEPCCTRVIVSPDGVVMIGDRPLPVPTINDRLLPSFDTSAA